MSEKKETSPNQKQNDQKKHSQEQLKTYVRYSGLAFQMMAVLGLAVWGGLKLDDSVGNDFPLFMITFALLAFVASLIVTIRSLPKD
ncbi:MAG: AtpZ/AtpI family protein [Cyclobacteriaceae bacterium]